MLEQLSQAWSATSNLEIVSVSFGLAYVILAARESSWCWPCALVGTGTAVRLFWDGMLPMESALNAYYLVMAVYGWWCWQHKESETGAALSIRTWGIREHSISILIIGVLCGISGYYLSEYTQAALPYLDSFTTWAAVITTWMVTRKILENWLYWIIINSASIYLFISREFYLYAVLFFLYVIIAIWGFIQWRHNYKALTQ